MNPDSNPTVCLDGSAVRRIREEKKLTQLYVAKVIGVTTDTVSRWENNRYPTIKRDNAVRLTEALEVPLEEILQKPQEESPAQSVAAGKPRMTRFLILAAIPILAAVGIFLYRSGNNPPVRIRAERVLPSYVAPGNILPVRVRLEAAGGMKGYILREHFPAGWKLIEANPPASSLDNEEGTARWIVKPGESRQVISYLIRVSTEAGMGKEGLFQGDVIANPDGHNSPAPVAGATRVEVAPYLWADLNGDGIIDDGEMLKASDTFDEMKGVHLDWKQLEAIWDAGSYRWKEHEQRFSPLHTTAP